MKSIRTWMFTGLSVSTLAAVATVSPADEFVATPEAFPGPFLQAVQADPAAIPVDGVLEASAVEPIGDGSLLLVAHDKKVPLRVVETQSGRPVGPPLTSIRFPAETPKSSKWEAMARDSEGTFYVAGSHSGKTEAERDEHARLVRFRIRGGHPGHDGPGTVSIDEESVVSWRLTDPLVQALRSEGLTPKQVDERKVEGLAIRERAADGKARRELVVGLRQPDDLVRAFTTDITSPPPSDSELPLSRLFAFDPGRREGVRCQLTSLEYAPQWEGFLVITATEDDQNAFHGNTLWFVSDRRIAEGRGGVISAEKIWVFEVGMKAEGLCLVPPPPGLADQHTLRVLITYDNDAHVTHIPSRFQVISLTRRVP